MNTKNQQPFFAHDANSRTRDKMIPLRMTHGVAGYGVYYMLLERLRESDGFKSDLNYDVLAFDLDCDKELIRSVIEDFGLFEVTDEGMKFHSFELTEKMEVMMEAKRRRREAARRAAEARWGKIAEAPGQNDTMDYPEVIEENKETDEKPTASERLIREIEILKTDNEWREAIKEEFHISEQQLTDFVRSFKMSCVCNGMKNGHATPIDAAKHCRSYIRKMINPTTMSNRGKSKNTSPINDTLSKEETERLKEFNRRQEEKRNERASDRVTPSGDNLYRNLGYDPSDCSMRNLYDPEWRKNNPPTHPEWIGRFPCRETLEEVKKQLILENSSL